MTDFDRLLPPLAGLVVFEAAFRHRSFTRAAEELYLSQASVSRRIKELEDDLGVALFERRRHDVEPTPAGSEFAASVRLSLGELSATAERLRHRSEAETSLTVLCSLALTSALVAPVLSDMQATTPELRVRLLSSCEPIEDSTEDFDIAIQYGPTTSRRFDVLPITYERVFPVCAPSVAAALPDSSTATILSSAPLLHVDYEDPTWPTWPTLLGDESLPRERVFGSYQVCLDAAERGEGVALGWEHSVASRLRSGSLVALDDMVATTQLPINAYTPSGRSPGAFVDDLLARLQC